MPTERIQCNRCLGKTQHEILHETTMKQIEDDGIEWATKFEMLQCRGCGDVTLRRTLDAVLDGNIPWEDNTVTYFPPAVSRRPPSWQQVEGFPKNLRSVLKEIYKSLDADNVLLPMLGARTLIDMLMLDKVGDVGNFVEKLKQLEDLGVISSRNREILAAALDLGNAAAHRGHSPKAYDVGAVMDIVENLLQTVYVLPNVAQRIKANTPPRPNKPSKPKPVSNLTH